MEIVRPRVEEKFPGGFTYFKLLVVMIVCSLKDPVNLVNTNVIVRLLVGKRMGKCTLLDLVEKFARIRKDLLRVIVKGLEAKYGQAYLLPSALYERI